MNIYLIWLLCVILWNYGFPKASPLEDVVVAVVLSFLSVIMKKYIKKNNHSEEKNMFW